MGTPLKLILAACIVNFGLMFVQPDSQITDQASITNTNDGSKIQSNFQNLFNSIGQNDPKKGEISFNTLKHELLKGRQVFDAMKDELQIARNVNAHKKQNFFERRKTNEHMVANKRETNKKDHNSVMVSDISTTTSGYSTTPYDYDYDDDDATLKPYGPETVTDSAEFHASPITGPFLEPSYYDCLMEAKWEMDDQRFYIRAMKESNKKLARLGMKIPELTEKLDFIEDFYNTSCRAIGRKMRGEEESEEKYDLTYKNVFLKLSRIWQDLITELDKHTPRYHCAGRIKKMKEEMYTASNASHQTYYVIANLQTKMPTTPQKLWNVTATTLAAGSL